MPRASLAAAAVLLCGFVRSQVPTPTGNGGPCLWWATRSPAYAVNDAGSSHLTGPAQFAAVEAGFDAWSQPACTDVKPAYLGLTASTQIGFAPTAGAGDAGPDAGLDDGGADGGTGGLVVWRRVLCGTVAPASDPCWAEASCDDVHDCLDDGEDIAVAVTSYFFRIDTGELLGAGTELNDHGFVFSTVDAPPCDPNRPPACDGDGGASLPGDGGASPQADGGGASPPDADCGAYGPPMPGPDAVDPTCVAFDVQDTMTHEAGHYLGFGHTPVAGATMNAATVAGDLGKRVLHPDDVDAVCTVYPAGGPTLTCIPDAGPPPAPIDTCGCNCGPNSRGPAAFAALLVAGGLVFLRRRRRA